MFYKLSSASGSSVITFICKVLHCSAELIFGATAGTGGQLDKFLGKQRKKACEQTSYNLFATLKTLLFFHKMGKKW